jgi:hypothetical protein
MDGVLATGILYALDSTLVVLCDTNSLLDPLHIKLFEYRRFS